MNSEPRPSSISAEVARLQQVEQELGARLKQQAVVARLAQHALDIRDLQALMDETVRLVSETLEVGYCKILEYFPEQGDLLLRAGVGWMEGAVGNARVGAELGSQAGYTLLSNEPVIVTDYSSEKRFAVSPLLLNHGLISGVSVVIPGSSNVYGVLGVHTRTPRQFSSDDTHFLQSVAGVLAAAIERLRTEAALQTSRDQLAIILQGVADGITVQNPTGRIIYANTAAAHLVGYSTKEELVSAPLNEVMGKFRIFDSENRPFPVDQLPGRLALQGKTNASATIRFVVVETGEERWSYVKSMPVFNASGKVEMAVNIFQDITELKRVEQSQRLLAEASKLLATSLDYSITLQHVAQLAVPTFADWCAVHILEEDDTARQVAVAHADPQKVQLVLDLQKRYPPNPESGVTKVLRTGQAVFYPLINSEFLEVVAQDAEHLKLLRELELRSAMVIPLVGRDKTLGAISLVWAESGHRYNSADVALAEELARRAALAIENARIFQASQNLNAELEARVIQRTSQLQTLITKLKNEIAERKRTAEALRKNEAVLHSLFEAVPDATILVDREGRIVRVTSQTEAMFGYSREELLGQPVDILLPNRFQRRHVRVRESFFEEPRTRTMGAGLELLGKRKDGSEFPVDVMLSPVETEEGNLVISAVRDITERKRLESELAEVQQRLIEGIEAERLHLAQELHDGPVQDLYGISFQVKSLEAALGESELEVQGSIAETVQHVIEMLRAMCGDLRPPTLAPFGLEKAIRAHIDQVKRTHPELDIELDLMADGQAITERIRLALFRIYQHSLSNVLRHAQARQVRIQFAFDEDRIRLEIQDDGCGFELPTRWVELARGGHLGLVGTVERVKAIGGQLKISSAPERGTLIQVVVPRMQEQIEDLTGFRRLIPG